MTPEKTTEQAVNEKVGIGAYLSLAFAVVFFSGLCASSQWWGVFDFTTVNGGFGRLVSGLPGEAAAVLLGGWMSMGGGVGVAVSLFDQGLLTGEHVAIVAPSIYLMGSQVQYMGRCLGVIGIKGSNLFKIMALPIVTAFVSLFVMKLIVLAS